MDGWTNEALNDEKNRLDSTPTSNSKNERMKEKLSLRVRRD